MKKKSDNSEKKTDSGFFGIFKESLGTLADIGVNAIIGNLKTAANETIQEAQKAVESATVKALKAAAIFVIMIFGLILVIVGLGSFLSATYPALHDGLGHVLVGGILMALGLLIQFFRR